MIESVLWIVFVLACILVSGVILLQEGKGGGLGEAFGGVGQQTFGVKAEGINKFTGWVSAFVVVVAIVITKMRSEGTSISFGATAPAAPVPGAEIVVPAEPANGAPPVPNGDAPAPTGDVPPASPAGDAPPPAPPGDGTPPANGDGK